MFNRVVLFCILGVSVLLKHVGRESSHDTPVVAYHVNHVVGFGVLVVSQALSLGQNVDNMFFFSFWRNEGRLFLRCFPVHRVERGVTL